MISYIYLNIIKKVEGRKIVESSRNHHAELSLFLEPLLCF